MVTVNDVADRGNANATATTIRIASWNLRYDSQPDRLSIQDSISRLPGRLDEPRSYYPNTKEYPWSIRRFHVANTLLFENVDLFGVQEALTRQVNDLQELLGSDWGWVGVGRDDGIQHGEYSAIFYKKSVARLIEWDTFWLSDTPSIVSRYPGASCHRICTTAHLELLSNNRQFTLMNAHFDDHSDFQRKVAASLMRTRAKYEALGAGGDASKPVFVLGDFNSAASGSDSGAYKIITAQIGLASIDSTFATQYAVQGGNDFKMVDLRGVTPKQYVSGDFATYTGFSPTNRYNDFKRIDFIFGGSNGGWNAVRHRTVNILSDDGVYASDHRPVLVDVEI